MYTFSIKYHILTKNEGGFEHREADGKNIRIFTNDLLLHKNIMEYLKKIFCDTYDFKYCLSCDTFCRNRRYQAVDKFPCGEQRSVCCSHADFCTTVNIIIGV